MSSNMCPIGFLQVIVAMLVHGSSNICHILQYIWICLLPRRAMVVLVSRTFFLNRPKLCWQQYDISFLFTSSAAFHTVCTVKYFGTHWREGVISYLTQALYFIPFSHTPCWKTFIFQAHSLGISSIRYDISSISVGGSTLTTDATSLCHSQRDGGGGGRWGGLPTEMSSLDNNLLWKPLFTMVPVYILWLDKSPSQQVVWKLTALYWCSFKVRK